MSGTEQLRLVEKLNNGAWEKIAMIELRAGDTFRLFEPDNNEQVGGLWKATGDAYTKDGVAGIQCEVSE